MTTSPRTVSDVMTPTAVAVGRGAAYKDMVELMRQWNVSALPVLEGDGRVIGVVSEADLLLKEQYRVVDHQDLPESFSEAVKARASCAEDLMSSPALTVHPSATVPEAARIMALRRVKRLPVTDDSGLLQGVVSRSDLLKVFLRTDEEIAGEIRHTVLAELPSSASMEVSVVDGVVFLGGRMPDRTLVPLVARAVLAVEGVVDMRLDLTSRPSDDRVTGHAG